LGVGDSIPIAPGNTYDLRAVSIVGGKTKPFVLGFEETSANEPTQNEAPYITKAPRFEGTYWKETIVFTVTAEDPDSQDRLQILVDGLPSGARFTPRDGTGVVTGNFFWKLGPSDVGSYRVTFTAKDQHSAKSKAWVTIINVCDDPVDCLE
jgi:hypothetical protein